MSQNMGDSWCLGTSVTFRCPWAWSGRSAVADVGDSWAGSGVLGGELALQVGDGDLVAVGDDQDLREPVFDVDLVEDFVDGDDSDGADFPDAGIGRQVSVGGGS